MVFTRRLYELDEVQAAFLCCLKKGSLDQSLFWLEELELSCEEDSAKDVLFDAWFLQKGIAWWGWLIQWLAYKETAEGRIALTKAFCKEKGKKDSTLWKSYCLGIATETAWSSAINRKPDLEWWRCCGSELDGSELKGAELKLELKGSYRKKCALTWLNYMKPSLKLKELTLEPYNLSAVEESLYKNLKKSRKYEIPFDCHLGLTRRGFDLNTTKILYKINLYTLLESPIWAGLVDDYCNDLSEWNSDNAKEEFYNKYFGYSQDIPDEWSKKEQEKSHGLPPSSRSSVFLQQWIRNWIPEEHILIHGKANRILTEWNSEKKFTKNILESIEETYESVRHNKRVYDICEKMEFTYIG